MRSTHILLSTLQLLFIRFISSESPSESLQSFFVPLNHYPLRSLPTHIISLPYHHSHFQYTQKTTLVVTMPMNTCSGARPATHAVSSKATKTTQARPPSPACTYITTFLLQVYIE